MFTKIIKINKIKLFYLLIFIISIFFISCKYTAESKREIKNIYPNWSKYIDKAYSMSEKERKGLLLMVGIKDKILSEGYIKILEKDMNFNGLIITDDLSMTGNIENGINFGINLNSNIYQNIEYMFTNIKPDIISCAKVLKIISENNYLAHKI